MEAVATEEGLKAGVVVRVEAVKVGVTAVVKAAARVAAARVAAARAGVAKAVVQVEEMGVAVTEAVAMEESKSVVHNQCSQSHTRTTQKSLHHHKRCP